MGRSLLVVSGGYLGSDLLLLLFAHVIDVGDDVLLRHLVFGDLTLLLGVVCIGARLPLSVGPLSSATLSARGCHTVSRS